MDSLKQIPKSLSDLFIFSSFGSNAAAKEEKTEPKKKKTWLVEYGLPPFNFQFLNRTFGIFDTLSKVEPSIEFSSLTVKQSLKTDFRTSLEISLDNEFFVAKEDVLILDVLYLVVSSL